MAQSKGYVVMVKVNFVPHGLEGYSKGVQTVYLTASEEVFVVSLTSNREKAPKLLLGTLLSNILMF